MILHLFLFITLLGAAGAVSKITGGSVVGVIGADLQLPCSVESGDNAVDDEVIWRRGDKIVHRYYRHNDLTDQQLPEYRGRTSLSREALWRGDLSLTLTKLMLSDAGEYRCIVRADTWFDDAPITVIVEAVVSPPSVSAVSLDGGRVRLQCDSTGWSTEPQVYWLDSRGHQLPADPTSFQRLPSGLRVTSIIVVEERHGRNFTCVVKSKAQREQTILVPLFGYPRCHDAIIFSLLLLILAMTVVAYRYEVLTSGRQRVKVVTSVDLSAADDIILKCQLLPAEGATEDVTEGATVEWREGPELICSWSGGQVTVSPPYKDRVTVEPGDEKRGVVSLRLQKLPANQAAVYTAHVAMGP